ncbi:MAG: hypothetical protein JO002_08195 [Burkholderiaceae bacterium]|nr:hypothetical protein [Burkholderiaceae bacterium]
MKFMKCTLLAVLILAGQAGALAQELTPDALAAKYPSGSIQTQETAEQALREVDQQRGAVEQKFADQQHDCYSRFFATKCLDAAKEERRVSLAQIRKVEVDANAYIRAARVVERDRNLAEKRARDAANPPKPLTEVAAPKQNSQSAPHDPDEGEHRIAAHEAKVKAQQQNEAAKVSERAAKFEAYNKKVADAEKRQQEVAQKKAEKQQEAEQKAAKAAKSQQDAAQAKAPASSSAAASTPVPAAKP